MSEDERRWQRMWQLFHGALELTAKQRGEFLRRETGGDAELCDEVNDLLANLEADPDFLSNSPAIEQLGLETPGDLVGKTIGPYRITRLAGEGGMGLVYEAEQEAPIQRRVAIKLIKPGMDTRDLLARFNSERQALALMQHPNIAQVYDAGVTENGRPFFAMEFVNGTGLDAYCDRHRLSVAERLRLFRSACDAVQHAHQKGVLHRDLKPSNILVTGEGESAVVKIIDFGIAKALTGRLTPDSVQTVVRGLRMGTPDYTAPELTQSLGADIDTASDVYSLGIVLYKLITSRLPQNRSGITETNDTVLDPATQQDAIPPSQMLSQIGELLAGVATSRSTSGSQLIKTVRGELDWIVSMAIAPERTHRYATVDALASDVERYLQGEVLVAGPPSNLYKARKFVRRNRLAVAFSFALAIVVLVGGITASIGWWRALNAEREASVQASSAQAVARFLTDMLEASGPLVARGRDTALLRELAETAVVDLEQGEPPHWFVESEVRQALGTLFMQLGDYEVSARHLDRALVLARNGFGENAPQTGDLWYLTGERANLTGDLETSETHFSNAIAIHEAVLTANPGQTPVARYYSESHAGLAEILVRYERLDEALTHSMRGLELAEKYATDDVIDNLNMVARVHLYKGNFDQSRHYYEESLRLARQRDEQDWQLGMTLGHYGVLLRLLDDLEASERAFREALAIFEVTAGPVHERTAAALNSLAVTVSEAGRPDEARPIYQRVLDIQLELLGEDHASVADTHFNMALNFRRLGDFDASIDQLQRSIDGYLKRLPRDHSYVMESEVLVGQVKSDAADHAGSERWLREFLTNHDNTESVSKEWVLKGRLALADALIAQAQIAEARQLLTDVATDAERAEVELREEIQSMVLQQRISVAQLMGDTASVARLQQQLDDMAETASSD